MRCKLETEVHARGADVEEQIAGRGDRMMLPADFAEGMQVLRTRRAEQAIPGMRADAEHTGKPAFQIAEADRAQEARKIGAELAHGAFGRAGRASSVTTRKIAAFVRRAATGWGTTEGRTASICVPFGKILKAASRQNAGSIHRLEGFHHIRR
jgi:hypothetical protein